MGLALPALRLIAREHKKKPLRGPILTIGRQCVYATVADIKKMLREEGLPAHPLASGESLTTNIPAWKDSPNSKYTSDRVFFWLLTGIPSLALDVSDYEGAEYVWDLNQPIPPSWIHTFATVIDSGSLEHIFNVSQALINLNLLTRPKGKIIHLTPANNYLEHGFYQFSPTLFIDYYGANNFNHPTTILIEQSNWDGNTNWRPWKWNTKRPYTNLITTKMTVLFLTVEKNIDSTEHTVPQQGQTTQQGQGGRTGEFALTKAQRRLLEKLPLWLITVIKKIFRKDLRVKPWGLKRFRILR